MNWLVLLLIVIVFLGLKWQKIYRPSMLVWTALCWVGCFFFLRFGFSAPLPVSIIREYMIIISMALMAYVSSDKKRWSEVWDPIVHFINNKDKSKRLYDMMAILPILVMIFVYMGGQSTEINAPGFSRSVHPAPPSTISFKGKTIDLVKGHNPLREIEKSDPEKFKSHLQNGKKVYYQNCFFCHGDAMLGKGIFAYGLDPIPTDFVDPATIGMLTEAFLFWRVSKGGIGLPDEGAPWASAMPAWEDFLSEQEIWEVIAFLYEYTGNTPRALEHHE